MTVKDIVGGGNKAEFLFYRGGQLWYSVNLDPDCDCENPRNFIFSVPIEDTGSGTFDRSMKAITLMRWIRKEIENLASTTSELVH